MTTIYVGPTSCELLVAEMYCHPDELEDDGGVWVWVPARVPAALDESPVLGLCGDDDEGGPSGRGAS